MANSTQGADGISSQWTPTHSGYQMVRYVDGSVALVAYDVEKGWEWGNTTPPSSQVIDVQNLGEHPFSDPKAWAAALAGLPDQVKLAFTRIASEGGIQNAQGAILVKYNTGTKQATITSSNKDATVGQDTQNAGATPGSVTGGLHIGDPLSFFTSSEFWKGLGLIIAGGLILIFAALEFLKMSGASPSVRVG